MQNLPTLISPSEVVKPCIYPIKYQIIPRSGVMASKHVPSLDPISMWDLYQEISYTKQSPQRAILERIIFEADKVFGTLAVCVLDGAVAIEVVTGVGKAWAVRVV